MYSSLGEIVDQLVEADFDNTAVVAFDVRDESAILQALDQVESFLRKSPKDLWIKALRSGEYEQAQSRLCKVDSEGNTVGYCCLGVVCDLYDADGWGGVDIQSVSTPTRNYGLGDLVEKYYAPVEVMSWMDMSDSWMRFFSILNDHVGASFEQIANVLETNDITQALTTELEDEIKTHVKGGTYGS